MKRVLICLTIVLATGTLSGADWLQFRGPNGASVSRDAAPPASWSETENVTWTADLPGQAASGPIVVKGRVYLTASGSEKRDRLYVLCFDTESGDELWRREFWATGRTLTHPFSAVAAPTPASDGQRIFAFFSSNDLACLDLDGNLLWYRGLTYDYPKAGNDIGMASSPVVVGETVVVQIENQGESFAAGIDSATGETRWRVPRNRSANWASPVALPGQRGGRHVVLLQARSGLVAHDAKTGEALWKLELPCQTTPSVAVTEDRIFAPANGLTVLNLPAAEGVPSIVWDSSQLNPSGASPIIAGEQVFTVNGAGVVTCGDAESGKRLWQRRVGGRHWSTPVIAGNHMYCINAEGAAKVLDIRARGKILSEFDFGEPIKGSPAIADGALYVRSDSRLWRIAKSR